MPFDLNSTTNHIESNLLDDVSNEYAASLLTVAAITLLLYDTLLSIDAEKEHIWNSKWSAITIVYLIVRYLSLFLQIYTAVTLYASTSGTVCSVYVWLQGFGGLTLEAAAEILVIYRVAAFGGNKRYLIVFLGILYVIVNGTTFVLAGVFLPKFTTTINPVIRIRLLSGNCTVIASQLGVTWIWETILAYHSILFACLLFQVVNNYRHIWNIMGFSRLQAVFIRDGIWAYCVLLINLLLCVISTYKAPNFLSSFVVWLWTTISICCCRLILNLRSTAHERRGFASQGTSTSIVIEVINRDIPLAQSGTDSMI